MGLVYLGRSEAGRTVAVKVVQTEYAGHPEFRRRFAREVASARRVGGSWTADVLDADPEAAVPWVATQYIPGPDLHSVVAEDFGPLPEHSVHVLAGRLALALRAVHEAGLIHRERRRAFGIYVAVSGGGSALAMLTAGFLLQAVDWRVGLYASVPLAGLALIVVLTLVHDRPGRTGARLDVLGVLLGSGGLVLLTYGLNEIAGVLVGASLGWTEPRFLVVLAVGALLLGAFLWWQTRTSSPLVAPYVLKDRSRVGGYLVMLLSGTGVVGLFGALGYYLVGVQGYPPIRVGGAFVPLAAAIVIGATQVSARLLHRTPPRVLIVAGLVTTVLGLVLLTGLKTDSGYATQVLPGTLLVGLGTGIALMPVFALAADAVAPQHSGGASAAVTATQHLGEAFGSAVVAGVLFAHLGGSEWTGAAMLRGCTAAFWWAAGGALLAALLAGLLVTAGRPEEE